MPKATPDARGGDGKFTRSPDTAERDAEAARLRASGYSYRRIGAELGVHQQSAYEMVQRALRATVEEAAEDVRRLELERLDVLYDAAVEVLERHHVTVSQGRIVKGDDGEPVLDDGPALQAIDRLLKIQERRAKLLGLDAATKTEVSGGVRYEVVGIDMEQLR